MVTNPNNNLTWDINDSITMEEIQNTVLEMWKIIKFVDPMVFRFEFFKAFFSKSDLSDNQDDSSDDQSVLNVYFHYLTKSGMVISLKSGIQLL